MSKYPKEIKTIKTTHEFQFKEKGSQFIGFAAPCRTEDEALEILESKKKQFYDATHNCYAFKVLPDYFKYSDDGEPNGTAGIRILNAIQHFDLSNIIVISTRYYGGTKLGVGPLGKAYYNSAFGVLNEMKIIRKVNFSLYELHYDFEFTKSAHHFLNTYDCKIKDNSFDQRPIISFLIKPDNTVHFKNDIQNASSDRALVKKIKDNQYLEIP